MQIWIMYNKSRVNQYDPYSYKTDPPFPDPFDKGKGGFLVQVKYHHSKWWLDC